MDGSGCLYAMSNRMMPGLYKIGFTAIAPIERAYQLSAASGVPYPFEVALCAPVEDMWQAERSAHTTLMEFRVNPRREFFQVPFQILLQYFHYLDKHPPYWSEHPPAWKPMPYGETFNPHWIEPGKIMAAFNDHVDDCDFKEITGFDL